ncbi:MAG: glycosyltransferase family 2 protein, partial [Candidatus Aenigmatarchaeota archaeon]
KIIKKKQRIIAIIPAFNESKTIESIVRETKKYVDEVVVVDDGSSDATGELAKKAGAKVIKHNKNFGLGRSLRDGFHYALKKNFDIIITLDADGQHSPRDIPKFIEAINEGYDFVLGERNLAKYPLIKKIGNLFLNFMTNFISGTILKDTESGFRAYTRSALKKIIKYIKAVRYEIACEIIFAVGYYNLKYKNVPIASEIYVKGVRVRDGIKIFLYMLRRRKRIGIKDYLIDTSYVIRKWIERIRDRF